MSLGTSLPMIILLWRFLSWIQIQTALSECHSGDVGVFLCMCEFLLKVLSGGQEQIVRKDKEWCLHFRLAAGPRVHQAGSPPWATVLKSDCISPR